MVKIDIGWTDYFLFFPKLTFFSQIKLIHFAIIGDILKNVLLAKLKNLVH